MSPLRRYMEQGSLAYRLSVFNENINKETAFRNKTAYEISVKRQIPYVNHFDLILGNKNFFNYRDHCHFVSHKIYNFGENFVGCAGSV